MKGNLLRKVYTFNHSCMYMYSCDDNYLLPTKAKHRVIVTVLFGHFAVNIGASIEVPADLKS